VREKITVAPIRFDWLTTDSCKLVFLELERY